MSSYDLSTTLETKGHILEFYGVFSGLEVSFKAFLTTYTDTINCKWQPAPTFGRPDPIQVYTGTDRTINLSWVIPSFSLEDAKNNLMKTSTLARMFYPEYSSADNASTISKAPLIKVKFANLIYDAGRGPGGDVRNNGLLGAASGMSWAPDMKDGFFDPENHLYPKTITVTIPSFAVLHQHTIGWEKAEAAPAGKGVFGKRTGEKKGKINDRRADAAQAAAPNWASDASLFPWSSAPQRVATNIGQDPNDIVDIAHLGGIFKGKK